MFAPIGLRTSSLPGTVKGMKVAATAPAPTPTPTPTHPICIDIGVYMSSAHKNSGTRSGDCAIDCCHRCDWLDVRGVLHGRRHRRHQIRGGRPHQRPRAHAAVLRVVLCRVRRCRHVRYSSSLNRSALGFCRVCLTVFFDQSISQSVSQAVHRMIDQPTDQPTNQPTNQPISQPTNRPINQPTNE